MAPGSEGKDTFGCSCSGIAFADILIFVQMGFEASLYTSATKANKMLDGDLILVDRQFQSLSTTKSFSRDRLYQVLSYSGVKSVSSIYVGIVASLIPFGGSLSIALISSLLALQNIWFLGKHSSRNDSKYTSIASFQGESQQA
jgi:hypothetical protein